AFFAHGHEARAQFMRGRGRKNEPARINAHDDVHRAGRMASGQQINTATEQARVGQDGRDVLELNSRLWKIGNVANGALQVAGSHLWIAHSFSRRAGVTSSRPQVSQSSCGVWPARCSES